MPDLHTDFQAADNSDSRLEWIEPAIIQLDVRETAINPSTGFDYGVYYRTGPKYPDCTRS